MWEQSQSQIRVKSMFIEKMLKLFKLRMVAVLFPEVLSNLQSLFNFQLIFAEADTFFTETMTKVIKEWENQPRTVSIHNNAFYPWIWMSFADKTRLSSIAAQCSDKWESRKVWHRSRNRTSRNRWQTNKTDAARDNRSVFPLSSRRLRNFRGHITFRPVSSCATSWYSGQMFRWDKRSSRRCGKNIHFFFYRVSEKSFL